MQTRNVLVVDDEAHITHVVSMKLRQAGLGVRTAADGEEAFRLACDLRPDLVITDFQMPLVSGYELSMKLHQHPITAGVPVLMVTARGHLLTPDELARTNIKALLCKPFSPRELLKKVQEILAETDRLALDAGDGHEAIAA